MKKNCTLFVLLTFSQIHPLQRGDQTFTKIVNFFTGIFDRKKKQNKAIHALKRKSQFAWFFRKNPSFSIETLAENYNPFLGR